MDNYIFRDTDDVGEAEYDISGADYELLIRTCCKYCTTFSLVDREAGMAVTKRLQEFEIPRAANIPLVYRHYGTRFGIGERYYRICPELCDILLASAQSLLEWEGMWRTSNPADPAFYREDGSVFFYSEVHDGEAELTPLEGEDVSQIVCKPGWTKGGTLKKLFHASRRYETIW